ncbi:hypothetical protein ACL6MW_18055 [Pseudomonas putida]|uniref:hypothetical protein n=1 Tax=Pseudomonas putida TaxID=303 RepID=UPI0012FDBCE0|nr:hypothetical protein [Pseudomonas putida]
MKVYRNSRGEVRNIGDWNYLITQDEDGNDVINNPLPDSYVESDEEVITGWDGGLYVLGDPRAEAP